MTAPDAQKIAADEAKGRIGHVIDGRYQIDSVLAMGGMGAVFLARHLKLKKRVALKILHPDVAGRPELANRFHREALAGAHVSHAHVAAATDFGELADGSRYLVTEYVRGRTLRDALLAESPMPAERAAKIARQIAVALREIHGRGVLHRDLKPRNVMLTDTDFVKVVDFGLARVDDARISVPPEQDEIMERLTGGGVIFGTIDYLAPEAAFGMDLVDERADLYALGVIFYEMLTGKHPFDAKTDAELFTQQRKMAPPPFAERTPGLVIEPELEAVVMKLLEKDFDARYQNAVALIEAIDRAIPSAAIEPRPPNENLEPTDPGKPLSLRPPPQKSVPPPSVGKRSDAPPASMRSRPPPRIDVPDPSMEVAPTSVRPSSSKSKSIPPPPRSGKSIPPPPLSSKSRSVPPPPSSKSRSVPPPPSSKSKSPPPPPSTKPKSVPPAPSTKTKSLPPPLPIRPQKHPRRSAEEENAREELPPPIKISSTTLAKPTAISAPPPSPDSRGPALWAPTSKPSEGMPNWQWGVIGGVALLIVVIFAWPSGDEGKPPVSPTSAPTATTTAAAKPAPTTDATAKTTATADVVPSAAAVVSAAPTPSSVPTPVGPPDLPTDEKKALIDSLRAALKAGKADPAAEAGAQLFSRDHAALEDPKIAKLCRELLSLLAKEGHARADEIWRLVATQQGSRGPDLIYKILEVKGSAAWVVRAPKLLRDPEVVALETPALKIAFELRDDPCNVTPEEYDRAVADGDDRTELALDVMVRGCVKNKKPLDAALSKLRKRLKKEKATASP